MNYARNGVKADALANNSTVQISFLLLIRNFVCPFCKDRQNHGRKMGKTKAGSDKN